jgi:hypothetical protein
MATGACHIIYPISWKFQIAFFLRGEAFKYLNALVIWQMVQHSPRVKLYPHCWCKFHQIIPHAWWSFNFNAKILRFNFMISGSTLFVWFRWSSDIVMVSFPVMHCLPTLETKTRWSFRTVSTKPLADWRLLHSYSLISVMKIYFITQNLSLVKLIST